MCPCVHTHVVLSDPEAVDETLLQLCSSQLKLLQLYTDIQQLYAIGGSTTHTELVSHTHTPTRKEKTFDDNNTVPLRPLESASPPSLPLLSSSQKCRQVWRRSWPA